MHAMLGTDVNVTEWQSIPSFEVERIPTKEVICLVCLRMAGGWEDGLNNSTHQTFFNSEAHYHSQYLFQDSTVQVFPHFIPTSALLTVLTSINVLPCQFSVQTLPTHSPQAITFYLHYS
jgi:hypothetical protein